MRFWRRRWMLKWFVPAIAAGALAAPASARVLVEEDLRSGQPASSLEPQPVGVKATPNVVPVPAGDEGFSWADAGVGAAGALSVLLVGGGTAVLVRRTRRPELVGA